MQTPKARSGSSEVPQRVSPRAACQLKTVGLEPDSASSSNQASRTPKGRSPKVVERQLPRSPVAEKKRPSRISELESQVSQLLEDLKKTKDQLSTSESWKKQAQHDAEESQKQILDLTLKLEESQKQLLELSATEEACIGELQNISEEQDEPLESKLQDIQNQDSIGSAALASAMNEIQHLKVQLDMVAESEAAQTKRTDSTQFELQRLKEDLMEALSLMQNMKDDLKDSKESEAQAQALASETLLQLETAKQSVVALRSDGMKAIEAYNSVASELEHSRARVNLLEGLVGKLEADLKNASSCHPQENETEHTIEETGQNKKMEESNQLKEEVQSLKSEVEQLRSALEAAEARCHEEQIQSTVQMRSAYDMVEQVKSESSRRETKLEEELQKARSDIEELKANLMDKETELQGISEENEGLHMRLEKNSTRLRESELEKELKRLKEIVADLKGNLMDKENELQNISEENEILKMEISKRDLDNGKVNDNMATEVEAARTAEREAMMKLGIVMEEADRSSRKASRVAEQLDAAQAANAELEAELRKLKVQSDQWRKAAEAAAAMLSAGNNGKYMERTGSLDSNYHPLSGKGTSPYSEDMDDELLKKKNGNMLKKIGVLWKKPQK